MAEVQVIDGGLLTTIQDAPGRRGWGRFGVPPGGAMDADAARLANALVANEADAAVLEITLRGPMLRWSTGAHVALAGADLGATYDGLPLPPGYSARLRAGATLRFPDRGAGVGPPSGRGLRAYLAVEGGFIVASVLGSASTDRRSGFGGFEGRALLSGDVLTLGPARSEPLRVASGGPDPSDAVRPLLVIPTPRAFGWFTREALRRLLDDAWTVAPDSDRSGIRLSGSHVPSRIAGITSLGVPVGAVQVPPSGEPIVTMVDGPVTGGYPVIGVIPRFEHGRLAQAVPGDVLRFARASVPEARRAAAEAARRARVVEMEPGDFAAGWAR